MSLEEATPAIQARLENEQRETIATKEIERLKKKYNAKVTAAPDAKK